MTKTWWPWAVGGGLVVMLGGIFAAKAKAQTPASIGPCLIPVNSGLTPDDLAYIRTTLLTLNNGQMPTTCHHDLVEALNYYAVNRRPDGSVVGKDGTVYPTFRAAMAAG